MGLGKTMQAITAIRLLLRSGQARRVLLICPKPLIPNWQREFKLWAEELPVILLEGDASRRKKMLWTMPGINVLIANYELMSRDLEELVDADFPRIDLLVLDEAQRVKNRESRTAQVARSIPRKRSWALTGTPIENRPEELASLYEFLEVVPPRSNPDLKQLQKLSKTYILRRTKDLVLTDLPPRLDRDEHLEMTPAQQHAYKIAEKEGIIHLDELGESISVQHVFELVLRLKQITNFDPLTGESAKLDRLQAEMEEIAESNGKAILFSQWTKALDWLNERLAAFNPLIYRGGVPTAKREPVLNRFRDDPNSHLLLMSYGTGAVGLNLQFAGYVFLFDRWWNPAVEDQAINRAHRIGQKNPVIVTRLYFQGHDRGADRSRPAPKARAVCVGARRRTHDKCLAQHDGCGNLGALRSEGACRPRCQSDSTLGTDWQRRNGRGVRRLGSCQAHERSKKYSPLCAMGARAGV